MAEEENENEEPKKSGGGILKLLIWLAVILFSIAGGAATPFVVASLTKPAEEGASKPLIQPEPEKEVAYIEFDEITVNLSEPRFSKFLKMNFSLQVGKSQLEEVQKLVDDREVVLKNWIQINLSEKTTEDINGKFGRNRIRREMLDYFNEVLFDDGVERVQDVLFSEFFVQ